MANLAQRISLNRSQDIPFNQLVLSQSNIRRTKAGVSIEDLAADIAHRGLLQSLHVRPVLDGDGAETGMFEIPAGGRRYRALQLLVKQKRMAKTQPVPCVIKSNGLAEEDSLAENVHREALHPLDQFRAFQELRDKGLSEDDIAARFFVTPAVVKQRLRLAAVSPTLLKLYSEDGMSLEQLMAFTVTVDQERQEQVWESLSRSYVNDAFTIRRQLTQNTVPSSDRRARFIGLEAYEEADGYVLRDLFSENGAGWLQDVALLDRLVNEKLKAEAEKIAAEGWKWIDVAIDYPYGHTNGFAQIEGRPAGLTKKEQARFKALKTEYEKLEAEYEDAEELPDEIDARLGQLEAEIEAFERRPAIYDPADKARAGVFLSLDAAGKLVIERGYVRPEDSTADGGEHPDGDDAPVRRAVITIGGEDGESDEDDAVKALPERLVADLTAYRTLALCNALAENTHVALTALLHRLCIDTFYATGGHERCLQVQVQRVSLTMADLKETPAAKAIAERHASLKADMPPRDADLWAWLSRLDDATRGALLAHCVSFGVNALRERADRYGLGPSQDAVTRRIAQADRIARAVGLDMAAAGWRPTVDNYLGRVTKTRILEAVREAKGEGAAQLIDHMKKGDMAKEAERLLDGAGWLPEPLRLGEETAADAALPDFLAEEDDPGDEIGEGASDDAPDAAIAVG